MGCFAVCYLTFEGCCYMGLGDDVIKCFGTPLSVKRCIQSNSPPFLLRHKNPTHRCAGLLRHTRTDCLMLLGSPPDMVHSVLLHRARTPIYRINIGIISYCMDFVKGLHRYAVYNKKYGKAKRLPVFQGKRATAYGEYSERV